MEVIDDGVYWCISSSSGCEVSSLVDVECDDNSKGVMGACDKTGVYTTIMIGRVCKKRRVDGIEFEVHMAAGCNEEVISSMVYGLSKAVSKLGS